MTFAHLSRRQQKEANFDFVHLEEFAVHVLIDIIILGGRMGKKKTSKIPAKKTESKQNDKSSHGNKGRNGNKRNGVVTAGADDYQFRRSVEGMKYMHVVSF